MTENKRFSIKNSAIVQDGYFIKDNEGKYSFPTTTDGSELLMYLKALNNLAEENKIFKDEIDFLKLDNNSLDDGAKKYSILYYGALQENKELKEELEHIQDSLWTTEHIKNIEGENKELRRLVSNLNKQNQELIAEINDLKFENEKKYRTIRQLEQMLQDVER